MEGEGVWSRLAHVRTRPDSSAQNLVRLSALVLVVVCVVVLAKGWNAAATLPNYGFYSHASPEGWVVSDIAAGGPADAAGVRLGDRILAVDGSPTFGPGADPSVGNDVQVGQSVRLAIEHSSDVDVGQAQPVEVVYTLGTYFSSPENVVAILTFTATSLLTLAVVVFVAMVKPADAAARLLLVGGGSLALMVALAVWSNADGSPWIEEPYYLAAPVSVTALLHLFLVFPARSPLLLHPWRLHVGSRRGVNMSLVLLYAVPLGVTLALTLPDLIGSGGTNLSYGDWSYVPDVAILVCVVAVMLRSYLHPPTPLARAQMRWIVWAFGVFLAVVIVALPVPLVLNGGVPIVSFVASSLAWLLIPLAVALAILRYRLFDVDAVVRATFLFPLLVTALIGGYVVVLFVLELLARTLFGPSAAADPNLNVLAALLLAGVAQPARTRLQAALDHLVHRDRLARRRLLAEAGEVFRGARSTAALVRFLTLETAERLELAGAWVALAPGLAPDLPAAGLPGTFEALLPSVRDAREPLLLDQEHDLGVDAVSAWYAAGGRLLVPLRAERVLGVWILGARRSGELFGRDDMDVLARIGDQTAVLLDYARLAQEQVRQAVSRRELERARELQQRLLPAQPAGWPGVLEVAARLRSARETSGDFYDVFPLGPGRVVDGALPPLQVAVGDVAGKGIAAALVMALARTALRASAQPAAPGSSPWIGRAAGSPAANLAQVGRLLHRDVGRRDFVACALAVIEPPHGRAATVRLRLANAGQVAPLLCRAGRAQELEPPGERLPLGVLADPVYCELVVELLAGDVVIFASDGLPEAPSSGGELYGFERLEASATHWAQQGGHAEAVLAGIWADIEAWSGPSPEHDDMTLLVLRLPMAERTP